MRRFYLVTFAMLIMASMVFGGGFIVDFNNPGPPGGANQISTVGGALTFAPFLSVTARTGIDGVSGNPLGAAGVPNGVDAQVFWGNLLNTGATAPCTGGGADPATSCYGLGVIPEGTPINDGGPNEALIFSFDNLVSASALRLTLIGVNGAPTSSNGELTPNQAKLFFNYTNAVDGTTGVVDLTVGPNFTSGNGGSYVFDFSTLVPAGAEFGQFAIESERGAFGVAKLELTPEPGSLFLLGSGLIGAAGFIRRKFKV